ncbi:hypothetical protein VST7929_01860 [Vibrio stylophorae]|uniref:DUF3261 domain-containing protein n=1 Tax=Vibrio stylophorae TaxID=659351 RepID=A0ABM8ZUW7_9VIBR|nr:DUF3261 domain-containing protein [Vibrio stylophorae]CAH0533978.1 hypothetical protein VST7929_01860 [Vibrio stylophorae]
MITNRITANLITTMRRVVILLAVTSILSSCALMRPRPAYLAEDLVYPAPSALGQSLMVSQLIEVQWQGQKRVLPAQLEVTAQGVALAGFSSWGTRLFGLSYDGQKITHDSIAGAELPDPKYVLFDLMLALWPLDAWQHTFANSAHFKDWRLVDSGKQRQLFDAKGTLITTIDYQTQPPLQGTITLTQHQLGYQIQIQTLTEDA